MTTKTLIVCDSCKAELPDKATFTRLTITRQEFNDGHQRNSFSYQQNFGIVDWCASCAEKLKEIGKPPADNSPPITLDSLIREIVEEIVEDKIPS